MRSLFRCARARAREFVDTLSLRSRGCHRAREHSRTPERSHAALTPPLVCQKCSARQLGARSSKLAPAATVRPHRECPLCSAAAHRALRTKRGLPRTAVTHSFKAGALNLARIAASLAPTVTNVSPYLAARFRRDNLDAFAASSESEFIRVDEPGGGGGRGGVEILSISGKSCCARDDVIARFYSSHFFYLQVRSLARVR